MRTEADIANMALAAIGARARIAALDEPTQEGRACSTWYLAARDEMLRDFPWPFATRRATLSAHDDDPPSEWAYRYALPDDCIAPRTVRVSGSKAPQDFEVALSDDGTEQTLLTDAADAVLVYTARVEDPSLLDPSAATALALKLGAHIALPVTGDKSLAELCEKRYALAVSRAWTSAHAEKGGAIPPDTDASWISARS